jgi:tetratricopeptide (TPR) repeat protein
VTDDRARWLRLSQLFDQVVDLDPSARDALLDAECADDPALRGELQRMLDADAADSAFDAGARGIIPRHDDPHDGDGDGDDDAPAPRLGPWRIDRELGRGGMGTVHAAHRDDDTAQRAAVKRLRRRWDGSTQAQRFLQERRILAVLSHPNIPRLLDTGVDEDGRPWFALEYIDGSPLTAWADAQRLPLRERVALFGQVCEAVQHAHEHFVVHRDLKPANILVDGDGRAKVLDFGVAKRMDEQAGSTRTGMFAGFTPEYAAPEQITGGAISAATDVHALGVVLYQLLAGRLPFVFAADDLRAAAEAISTQPPPRLELAITTGSDDEVATRLRKRRTDTRAFRRFVRGDLGRILQTALAKEPQRRYGSVRAFADDLQRFLEARPVSVSGDTLGYRAGKFIRRNRLGMAMGAIAVLALVGGATGIVLQTRQARAEAVRANLEARRAESEAGRAETEAARAIASRDFLFELLGRGSPESSGSRHGEITVGEALALARERLDGTLREDPHLGVDLSWLIASVHVSLGEHERARAVLEPALAIMGRDTPPLVRARAHSLYARTLLSREDLEAAEPHARSAIALLEGGAPDDAHAAAHETLSTILFMKGDDAAALAEQQRATGLYVAVHGQASARANNSRVELSYFLAMMDRHPEAIGTAQAAVDAFSSLHGDTAHPDLTHALWSLGYTLHAADRPRDALVPLRRALPLVEEIYTADSTKFARSLQLLALSEIEAGEFEQGVAHARRATELYRLHAPGHPLLAFLAIAIADALMAQGDPAGAAALIAAQLRDRPPKGNPDVAHRMQIMLAQARIDAGQVAEAAQTLPALVDTLQASGSSELPGALLAEAYRLRLAGELESAGSRLDAIDSGAASKGLRARLALERALLAGADGDATAAARHGRSSFELFVAAQMEDRPEAVRARAFTGMEATPPAAGR